MSARLPLGLWVWPLTAGAASGVALRLAFAGDPIAILSPMSGAFIWFTPLVVGSLTAFIAERSAPRTLRTHFAMGTLANIFFVAGTLALYLEGLICAVLALPLFAVLGGTAGAIAGWILKRTRRPSTLTAVFPLPLVLSVVFAAVPLPDRVDEVNRTIDIQAPAEVVWREIMEAAEIRPDEVAHGLIYRVGVPVPEYGILNDGDQPVRRVRMGKGIYFDQPVLAWEPNEYVTFGYRFYPDSIPPRALDDHVTIGGRHFELLDTTYRLRSSASETTVLSIQIRYRVSTHFNWYARPLARLLISDFENTILKFYRSRSETT